jgi:hypothetical protein
LMLLKIQWLNQIHAMPRFEVAAGFLKNIFRKNCQFNSRNLGFSYHR